MRISFLTTALVALAAESVVASTWFGQAAYNKWHETELERWLSDHNIPYPKASDRKDLLDLVKDKWDDNVATPYNSWDTTQLQKYLAANGQVAKDQAAKGKDGLVALVKQSWTETTAQASDAYDNVQEWIFDSWTDSQIKAYLDYHGIPNPTPRTRDSLLHTVRSNYAAVAKKAGETVAYPGDWLYSSWSESDLKAWLDERGIPAPQPTSRDKLIASVRRNSRVASKEANKAASSLSVSAASVSASLASSGASAYQSLTDELLNSWSESQLKKWADDNGVPVPQGSKKNELVALVRKHRSRAASSVSSGYGAATSSAGNAFARATDDIYAQGKQWLDWAQYQIGIGSEEAKSSIVSAASSASSYAASVSSVAEKSASSASKVASKSGKDAAAAANSARNEVSKSAASAAKIASSSASSAAKVASSSAASLAQIASSSLASAAKVASSSAASAAKLASSSASSAARVAASSASSAGKVAASSASSAGKVGASSASSLGRDGAKSAASLASKGADSVKSAAASVKNEL